MKMYKAMAALLALCLMVCGAFGALAEQGDEDVIADLLRYFLNIPEEEAVAPEPETEAPGAEEEPEAPAAPDDGEPLDPDDQYVVDEIEEEPIVVEQLVDVDDYAVNESLPDDWLNILLLGTDSRTSKQYSRTDSMIVLSINEASGEARLTSIMRDIWVDIPDHGGAKLNAACVYGGPELTMRLINEYFGLNIEKYALVNMKCLSEIVDMLGGIRLDISRGESRAMNRLIQSDRESGDANRAFATASVSPGTQVLLNGKQALAYTRIRKLDSDYVRTQRQRTVLITIARQLQQINLLKLAGIVTSMLQYVETNMATDEIMAIAKVCMKLDVDALAQFRIPAEDTFEAGMFGTTWCIKPDFEANARQLHEFIYGD